MFDKTEIRKASIIALIALSMLSCITRFDFNVFFGIVLLLIDLNYYNKNKKNFPKLMFHLVIVACIADLIWMIVMIPFWTHSFKSEGWNLVKGMRVFSIILAILELAIKGILGYLFYNITENKTFMSLNYNK